MEKQAGAAAGGLRVAGGGRPRRRGPKAARELLGQILAQPAPPGAAKLGGLEDWAQQQGRPLEVYEAMLLAQVAQALQGDLKAAQFVRDTMGDKPTEKQPARAAGLTAGERALLQKLAARLGLGGGAGGDEPCS